MAEIFDAEKIRSLSGAAKVYSFAEVDSTNTVAKKLAAEGAENFSLVVAMHQTGGKGRQNKSFFCSSGSGIYMSAIIKTCDDFTLITSAAAAAVRRAIVAVCGIQSQIKWVNDIYLNGKKVCGILAESYGYQSGGAVKSGAVCGIGINVFKTEYPDDIIVKAGSLYGDCDGAVEDRTVLMERLCGEIAKWLFEFCKNIGAREFLSDCRDYSAVIGKTVTVKIGEEEFAAKALGIDDSGALIIERGGKTEKLFGGEISIVI